MILAKLQCESRKYRKITIYWVGGREQTLYAGVEFPKNRPGQESKELASKTRQERSKLAPGLSLQGDKSPTLTFLAPGLLARRPAEVRPSAPLSLLESVAVRRLEPVGRTQSTDSRHWSRWTTGRRMGTSRRASFTPGSRNRCYERIAQYLSAVSGPLPPSNACAA